MINKKLEISDYKVNGKDDRDRVIEKIYYNDQNQFIIYFVEDDYLNAHMRRSSLFTDYKPSKEYDKKLAEVDKYILYLENNPKEDNKDYDYIRKNTASAIKMCAQGNHDASVQYIQNIIDEIRKDVINPQKRKFILGSGIFTIALTALALYIYYQNKLYDKLLLREAIFCMSFSSLGNLFYYVVKMFETEDSENNLGIEQGYINFSKSAISGLIIYTLIKSKLLLGNFSDNILSMVTFSLISGFSDDIPVKALLKVSEMITGSDGKPKESKEQKDSQKKATEVPELKDIETENQKVKETN